MRPSSWLRPLLLTGAVLCCLGELRAGDQHPDGLPREQVTLRDGRRLIGWYDPAVAILWLDGPYRARLRLRHGDVIRRTPIADSTPAATTVAVNGSGIRQLTIRLREQQVAELERRRQDTAENIRLLTSTLNGLESLLADLGRKIGTQPDPVADASLISQQQHMGQQISEIRRRLMQLDDHLKLLDRRREQAAQVLARARTSSTNANEPTALPDPMIEMRLQALEDEVRALRADNQDLRRQIDRLQPSAPPTGTPPDLPPPTEVPVPPATPMPTEAPSSERVARR